MLVVYLCVCVCLYLSLGHLLTHYTHPTAEVYTSQHNQCTISDLRVFDIFDQLHPTAEGADNIPSHSLVSAPPGPHLL